MLEDAKMLRDDNRMFMDRYIRLAGIAGNMGLTCVRGSHSLLANPGLVCGFASVPSVEVGELDQLVELN